jgi:hypothetical protein
MTQPMRAAGLDQRVVYRLREWDGNVELPAELADVCEPQREGGLIADAHLAAGRERNPAVEKSSLESACNSSREAGPWTFSMA